jgi:hypothetical protein
VKNASQRISLNIYRTGDKFIHLPASFYLMYKLPSLSETHLKIPLYNNHSKEKQKHLDAMLATNFH